MVWSQGTGAPGDWPHYTRRMDEKQGVSTGSPFSIFSPFHSVLGPAQGTVPPTSRMGPHPSWKILTGPSPHRGRGSRFYLVDSTFTVPLTIDSHLQRGKDCHKIGTILLYFQVFVSTLWNGTTGNVEGSAQEFQVYRWNDTKAWYWDTNSKSAQAFPSSGSWAEP